MGYSEVDPILDTDHILSVSSLIPDGEGIRYSGTESLMPEYDLNASISSLTTVLGTTPSVRCPKERQSDVEFARETYSGRGSERCPLSTAIIGERVMLKESRTNGYLIAIGVFVMAKC